MMKLERGDKIDMYQHGELFVILTVTTVNEKTAFASYKSWEMEFKREHNGSFVETINKMHHTGGYIHTGEPLAFHHLSETARDKFYGKVRELLGED